MRIIGINGLKTAGKDTTYECVRDVSTGTVKRGAFADKLKIMAMLALGYEADPATLIGLANKLKEDGGVVRSTYIGSAPRSGLPIPLGVNITGREYLQRFGGKAREVFGESFWVDQVLPPPTYVGRSFIPNGHRNAQRLAQVIDPWTGKPRGDFDVLCVTDVRYPNEAQRVLALGGEVWEVRRPGLVPDGHASEAPLPRDLVSAVIPNDGTVDDLRQRVEDALLN